MFWCCTGSGMENFTKLGDSIYFRANDTLLVNQYVASKVTWEEKESCAYTEVGCDKIRGDFFLC